MVSPTTNDPLAGQREVINKGETISLLWPDVGKGCPVEVNQVFKLRSCEIRITRTHRCRVAGKWMWRAEFARADKRTWFLDRRGGLRATKDPRIIREQGMRSPGELDAMTIDSVDEEDRDAAHRDYGDPPEPAAPPPYEVPHYTESKASEIRFARERAEAQRALDELPIEERVRRLRALQENGAPVGREVRAIAGMVAKAERKAGVRRAA